VGVSFAHVGSDSRSVPPAVRVGGVIIAVFGLFSLYATAASASGAQPPYTWIDYAIPAVLVGLGVALSAGFRWAGILAVLAAGAGIFLGIVAFFSQPDFIPGENLYIGLIFLIPSAALLATLLNRRAREWMLGRRFRAPLVHREDQA
jgi:hypothetical protein